MYRIRLGCSTGATITDHLFYKSNLENMPNAVICSYMIAPTSLNWLSYTKKYINVCFDTGVYLYHGIHSTTRPILIQLDNTITPIDCADMAPYIV